MPFELLGQTVSFPCLSQMYVPGKQCWNSIIPPTFQGLREIVNERLKCPQYSFSTTICPFHYIGSVPGDSMVENGCLNSSGYMSLVINHNDQYPVTVMIIFATCSSISSHPVRVCSDCSQNLSTFFHLRCSTGLCLGNICS